MGQIGTRVTDEFEKEFVLEAASKGKNKSDYLKEIIDARHTIDFLKSNDGLLIILTKDTLARFQYFAGLQNLDVDVWVRNLLHEMYFDNDGNPCTDTSIFQKPENDIQSAGLQLFANVNTGVNEPVNSRKQQILQNLSEFVYSEFWDVSNRFYQNSRQGLISLEFLQTIFDALSLNTKQGTNLTIDTLKILLINLQNVIKYFYESNQNISTELQVHKLNYMLYEDIDLEEVQKVESFFEFLNTFK